MQATPPETTEKRRLVSEATTPASRLPSDGALATWANSIPERRPRRASGVAGGGEERDRHREDHRVRVDEEDPAERRLRPHVAEALDDRAQARTIRVVGGRERRKPPHAPQGHAEGGHVEDVGERESDRRDK